MITRIATSLFSHPTISHALALEILVDREEVLDLLEKVLRHVGDVEVLLVVRIVHRHGEDLVVRLAAVEHLQHADRAHVDLAAGKRRLVDAHEHVERIVVLVQRARNESVVARIVHGAE